MKIIGVGAVDLHAYDIPLPQRPPCCDVNLAVDLRRIALAPPYPAAGPAMIEPRY
jgi:hypothetical protein